MSNILPFARRAHLQPMRLEAPIVRPFPIEVDSFDAGDFGSGIWRGPAARHEHVRRDVSVESLIMACVVVIILLGLFVGYLVRVVTQ